VSTQQVSPKPSAFLETIILLLMPYFLESATTVAGARLEILRTLASYAARTRPNFLLAAQVIALGMTTLDVLHEARTLEMSVPMRLRYRGNANSLNRAMLQTEKSLEANLADENAPGQVQTEQTQAANPAPEAEPDAAPHSATVIPDSAAATVMEALRLTGLAAPTSVAPPSRGSPRPPPSALPNPP
jgi:hypothetical protein